MKTKAFSQETRKPSRLTFSSNTDMGGPAWYFWLRGNYNPDIFEGEKKDFPTDFFESACKAMAFIHDKVNLTENLEIVAGERFLR